MGAIGAMVIGVLMDHKGIDFTMMVVSLLPLLLIVAFFLPKDKPASAV